MGDRLPDHQNHLAGSPGARAMLPETRPGVTVAGAGTRSYGRSTGMVTLSA